MFDFNTIKTFHPILSLFRFAILLTCLRRLRLFPCFRSSGLFRLLVSLLWLRFHLLGLLVQFPYRIFARSNPLFGGVAQLFELVTDVLQLLRIESCCFAFEPIYNIAILRMCRDNEFCGVQFQEERDGRARGSRTATQHGAGSGIATSGPTSVARFVLALGGSRKARHAEGVCGPR